MSDIKAKSIYEALTKLSPENPYLYLEVNPQDDKTPLKVVTSSWLGRCWRKILSILLRMTPCCLEDSLDKVVRKLHGIGTATLKEVLTWEHKSELADFRRRLESRVHDSAIKDIYESVIESLGGNTPQDKTSAINEKEPFPKISSTVAMKALEKAYPISFSDPEKEKVLDRILGGALGQFVGDAMGVLTEFMNKDHIKKSLPEILEPNCILTYDMRDLRISRKAHNYKHLERFEKQGWTDDSDQFICIFRALERHKRESLGKDIACLFAEELMDWRRNGLRARDEERFLGRKNPNCQGLGDLVGAIIEHSDFLTNPIKAAEECWLEKGSPPNGAIMRTAAVALAKWHNFEEMIKLTKIFCKVTHADPRCIASCVTYVTAMALLLRGERDFKTVKNKAIEMGRIVLREELTKCQAKNTMLPDWKKRDFEELCTELDTELVDICNVDSWDQLDLDEGYPAQPGIPERIGYTYKCLGAAFYSLKLQSLDVAFPEVFRQLVAEGGDADTNGCVAAALMGAWGGIGIIPAKWKEDLECGGREPSYENENTDVVSQVLEFAQNDILEIWSKEERANSPEATPETSSLTTDSTPQIISDTGSSPAPAVEGTPDPAEGTPAAVEETPHQPDASPAASPNPGVAEASPPAVASTAASPAAAEKPISPATIATDLFVTKRRRRGRQSWVGGRSKSMSNIVLSPHISE
jgi:ADP-ribosylglycohydrolase